MAVAARADTLQQRDAIYRRLNRRNGAIGVLRFALPALGVLAIGGLVLGIYAADFLDDFNFANVTIDRNNLVVETPSYSSVGIDGTTYDVTAAAAKVSIERMDTIELSQAVLDVTKSGGGIMQARAQAAQLSTSDQQVLVHGVMEVDDSEGITGTLNDALIDMPKETLVTGGAVDLKFESGATVVADNLVYEAKVGKWSFNNATVTIPDTPRAVPEVTSP